MSDLAELLTGSILLVASFGTLAALLPRKGRAISWVRKPFVEPSLAILIVAAMALGVIFLANYFTTIDNFRLAS